MDNLYLNKPKSVVNGRFNPTNTKPHSEKF